MSIKKILTCLLVITISFVLTTGCHSDSVTNDSPLVIKIAHTDSVNRSTHIWCEWLGEYLEEKAPGKFIVEIYSDGQLGDTPELIKGIKSGTITMCFDLSSSITSNVDPAASCIDLPSLYSSYDDWVEGTFQNGGLELFNETLKDSGLYCLDMYYNGMKQIASTTRTYHSLADLSGQRIRVAKSKLNVAIYQTLGASPVPLVWGDAITALSQNKIDALDSSLGVFNDFSIHEIAPYITLTNHASSPFPIICSQAWINSIPADLRQIFEDGVHKMAAQQREEEHNNELAYIERFKREGAVVEYLSPEENAALFQAVQPVYDYWRTIVGDEMMDKWLATVPK